MVIVGTLGCGCRCVMGSLQMMLWIGKRKKRSRSYGWMQVCFLVAIRLHGGPLMDFYVPDATRMAKYI